MFSLRLDERAELRPLEPWQAGEFAAAVDRAREHLRPWIPFASRVVDFDSARELLQRFADKQAADTGAMYGIWVDGALRGGTLFRTFDTATSVCEIGVWLDPSVQGRGLVQRAVTHMIDHAVRVRGMKRVEWLCAPANQRSKAVAVRLGMTHEGTLRSSFVIEGRRVDSEVWSVLADEWLARGETLRSS
jgi:RimJ/RimL family protein N-acetyltransferase